MNLQRLVFGRALPNRAQAGRKIGVVEGVPAMGLDGLGSSAYGPEAALAVLIPAGALGLAFLGPITAVIVALLVILYVSYRQTIRAYPTNGGAYTVAKANLGRNASLVAAVALMIDYVLNVAAGISAGVAALVSAVPALHPYTLWLCLGLLGLVTLMNLRGTLAACTTPCSGWCAACRRTTPGARWPFSFPNWSSASGGSFFCTRTARVGCAPSCCALARGAWWSSTCPGRSMRRIKQVREKFKTGNKKEERAPTAAARTKLFARSSTGITSEGDSVLQDILLPNTILNRCEQYFASHIAEPSEALRANAFYFGNAEWAQEYLQFCHRDEHFKSRWLAAGGDWSGKVVVDLGCGPGNVFATLGGTPKLLVGVDVAPGSLKLAAGLGYTAVLGDAARTPFRSEIADIVAINASLHHCDRMEAVLREAARLVKPNGLLITDHDPQLTAWDYKGLAKLLWNARIWVYRATRHGFHKTGSQQSWGLKTEVHHCPGDGVTKEFFENTLAPLGFDVDVHPHNHQVGADALEGVVGPAQWKYRLGNLLSGRDPSAPTSALSLMCVARKHA
jgi:ubiquinone/menaquinone biosynthesis C-methylase UbiE